MAKYALVYFEVDQTVDIVKKSSCTIRTGFQRGLEVDVRYGGQAYVGTILRTDGE